MRTRTLAILMVLSAVASNGFAQPARPADPPGTVTLAIPEYNRLIDLARQPVTPTVVPPVSAVLSSAQLRIRVDRDTVRGVFNLAGDVLHEGVSRVHLLSGAT